MVLTDNKEIAVQFPYVTYVQERDLSNYNNCTNVQAVVCSRGFVKSVLKNELPNLRFIQLLSAGYEGVDLKECTKKGIWVSNAANVYSVGMAEFVVLCLLRSAKRYNASIHNNRIRLLRNYHYITELAGKTVTILGVGGIGSEVAKRLKAFDMCVYGYAKHTRKKDYFDRIVHTKDELKGLLGQSNYVVSTLPDNNETIGFIDKEILDCMNECITIVNVGRRKVFNEDDLFVFMKNKWVLLVMILGEQEHMTNSYYRIMKNITYVYLLRENKENEKQIYSTFVPIWLSVLSF